MKARKETAEAVVITGLGSISAAGLGSAKLARQLLDSRPLIAEVPPFSPLPARSRLASIVPAGDLQPWLSPMAARRMSRPSKLAVVAARMAVADANLAGAELDGVSTAVGMGTAFGPSDYSERILAGVFGREGPQGVSPALFTESVANAPAAQVALAFEARGPNLTIAQREASGWMAVAAMAREVAGGRSRFALAGCVDEINPLLHAVLDRFGALAGRRHGTEVARPFDRFRDGFLLAEGAAVVVLESAANAERRGARVLARVGPSIAGFDPRAPATGWSRRPATLAARLADGLARAGVAPADLSAVISSASGARSGDRLEALILRSLWSEEPMPPVLAPKGVVGEYGGGALGAAVLAAAGCPFGPTAGFEEPDPELGLTPHQGGEPVAGGPVLVSSLAAGGAAVWTLLYPEARR